VVEDAFTSSSRSPLKAFSGNVRFYLISRNGREVSKWSAYPDEDEVIFKPGTRFRVLDFVRTGRDIEVFLEEV